VNRRRWQADVALAAGGLLGRHVTGAAITTPIAYLALVFHQFGEAKVGNPGYRWRR